MSTRKDKFTKKDSFFMNLAFNLARDRHGLTGQNPSVGCVIVKNKEIVLNDAPKEYVFKVGEHSIKVASVGVLLGSGSPILVGGTSAVFAIRPSSRRSWSHDWWYGCGRHVRRRTFPFRRCP